MSAKDKSIVFFQALTLTLAMFLPIIIHLCLPNKKTAVSPHTRSFHPSQIRYIPESDAPDSPNQEIYTNIHAWIALTRPDLFLTPNATAGFKRFETDFPLFPFFYPPEQLYAIPRYTPLPLNISNSAQNLHSLRRALTIPWSPQITIHLPQTFPPPPLTGIFWKNAEGLLLSPAPSIDLQLAQEHFDKTPATSPTQLEILNSGPPYAFRVLLRHSCGNTELDALAIQSIRRFLLEQSKETALTGNPPPFEDTTLDILWKLAQ